MVAQDLCLLAMGPGEVRQFYLDWQTQEHPGALYKCREHQGWLELLVVVWFFLNLGNFHCL